MYKLRDWVDETRLTKELSCNVRAIEYLENHEHLIDNEFIFMNKNAIHIIEKRIQNAKKYRINLNENAVNFLRNNKKYIVMDVLCGFEHGIEFVDECIKNNELHKISWVALSANPAAMHILNDPVYYKYLFWSTIIKNGNAVELVKRNLHRLNQNWIMIYEQPHLSDIIEQYMDKINWNALSSNYNAIHILETNIDKIFMGYVIIKMVFNYY